MKSMGLSSLLNLLRSITPTKKLSFHRLPKEYFVENRKNVTVKRINDRMLWVHHEDPKGKLKDPGVKKAYRILEKKELPDTYKEWREKFGPSYADNIVQEAAAAKEEGKEEAFKEVAKKLIKNQKLNDQEISDASGLSLDEVKKLRT